MKSKDKDQKKDYELVFGKNPVLEVIENSKAQVNKIWINEQLSDHDFRKRVVSFAKEKKIPYHFVPSQKLNSLTNNQNHQGIVMSISPVEYISVSEIIEDTLTNNSKVILIAHEIEDTHNLGAMIRTLVAGGGRGVILTGRKNVGINATAIKTSAGTIFQTKFARATNCVNVLNTLKESGFWVVGAETSPDNESIYKTNFPEQVAILMGNEHEGLGPLIKKNCDFTLRIPISERIDSLNVSVAFGIILFEILRQSKYT